MMVNLENSDYGANCLLRINPLVSGLYQTPVEKEAKNKTKAATLDKHFQRFISD